MEEMSVKKFEPLFDFLGELLAVVLVAVYILTLANVQWNFITNETVWEIMAVLRLYGSVLLVGVGGMEAVSKRSMLVRWIFYAAVAIIVIFLFFPDTYAELISKL